MFGKIYFSFRVVISLFFFASIDYIVLCCELLFSKFQNYSTNEYKCSMKMYHKYASKASVFYD
jgi:hypothetical protein